MYSDTLHTRSDALLTANCGAKQQYLYDTRVEQRSRHMITSV